MPPLGNIVPGMTLLRARGTTTYEIRDMSFYSTMDLFSGNKSGYLASEYVCKEGGSAVFFLNHSGVRIIIIFANINEDFIRSITIRFGGRAVLIDTGMLASVYKGRASALEIDGDKLTAYYEDGTVSLP